jgi:histidine triad (HIT) family protein
MSGMEENCIFCEIIRGDRPADMVYSDDKVVAFWDANPKRSVHILVVPREHIPTLNHIGPDNDILSAMGRAGSHIAREFGVDESGYKFLVNVNSGGGQVIFHIHAHILAEGGTVTV